MYVSYKKEYIMDRYNAMTLAGKLYARLQGNTDIVFLCLGTSKMLTDSFGPMVGSLLKSKYNIPTFVYGDLNKNVNAINLEDYLTMISHHHKNCHVVVIDSALGNENSIGTIRLLGCGTIPRSALDNSLSLIGDSSILAIIESYSKDFLLIKTKKWFINELADTTASAINHYFALAKALKLNEKIA